MEPRILLGELRALADSMPDFEAFKYTSRVHHEWLGKADALIRAWNASEGAELSDMIGKMGYRINQNYVIFTRARCSSSRNS